MPFLMTASRWVAQKTADDPEFFKKLASVHKPEFLFIGCSDARLSVQHMLVRVLGLVWFWFGFV